MNAINEEVIRQLDEKFTAANSNPDVKVVVLEGAGKAFIAGADIQFFIRKIKQNKIDDICKFTRYGHSVLNKIDTSNKPVIAKLDGLALGGGAEIALTADTIIATEKGSIGFPETGIGIYPGLGGTQRTTKYIAAPPTASMTRLDISTLSRGRNRRNKDMSPVARRLEALSLSMTAATPSS